MPFDFPIPCAASLLQNRDEEDGGNPLSCHILLRKTYAISVALFNRFSELTQSQGYAGIAPSVIRHLGHLCPEVSAEIGMTLGLPVTAGDASLSERVAAAVQQDFEQVGWRHPLSQANIPAGVSTELLKFILRNFNANHDRLLDGHAELRCRAVEEANALR